MNEFVERSPGGKLFHSCEHPPFSILRCITTLRLLRLYEVECAIKHLKSGKATGPDDIRNEYITYEKQNLKHILRELFNVIYETGAYPDQWSTGVTVPIYKKGDTNDLDSKL